jgi:hypothetical protein
MIIFEPSSHAACRLCPSTGYGKTWSWRNSRSAPTHPRLHRNHSTPTTPLPHLPLLRLIPLAMAYRAKDRVTTTTAIARMVEVMVAAAAVVVVATVVMLLARATNLGMPPSSWPSFYNPWNGTTDMYPGLAPGGGGQQQHHLPQQQALIIAPRPTMVGPLFTPPLVPILAPPPMYAA